MATTQKYARQVRRELEERAAALEEKVEARHEENLRRLKNVEDKVDEVGRDVKSLLESRSFSRGIWRTATIIATVVSGVISVVIAVLRGH